MPKIYHYTRLETALEFILPTMKLRTNNLTKMNDPKENQPWAFGGRNFDLGKSYPDTYSKETHIDHQYKLGFEIKQGCQIICFVRDEPIKGYLNEMMWAHYSDNHRGVCLEIDSDKFIEENKLTDFVFDNVTYGRHERPYISWNPELTKDENINNILKNHCKTLLLRKSFFWEHENESRLIFFSTDTKFLSINESLTGIYLGLLMPYEYRPSIDNCIKDMPTKIFDLYYEDNIIEIVERDKFDFRPFISRKILGQFG